MSTMLLTSDMPRLLEWIGPATLAFTSTLQTRKNGSIWSAQRELASSWRVSKWTTNLYLILATISKTILTPTQPMTSPDKITVYQRLIPDPSGHLSSQSAFRLEVMILSEARQRPAARCFEDIVLYDYKKNRKTVNLPPFVMDQFKAMWEQQEKEAEKWQQRITEIENRVRALEVESWDRVDAVENNGSASQWWEMGALGWLAGWDSFSA